MSKSRIGGKSGRQLTRRVLLRGAVLAGAVTGVTTLAGCAGPSAPSVPAAVAPTAASGGSGPNTAAVAPTAAARAKLGGTFRTAFQGDPPNLDVHQVSTFTLQVYGAAIAYSKLIQYRADVAPGETIPAPDLAERWEQPDDVTYIFKLRGNAKFQNIAPVNGRVVTAEDVKYSFERQVALKTNAGRLPNLDRIEVVDPSTVKLIAPKADADFLVSLATTYNKVIPRETVDLKGDLKEGPVIGSGPWIFDKWQPNSVTTLNKNPDYYFKESPRVDRLELLRVNDPATLFAGFRSKELDTISGGSLTPRDADNLKKSNPEAVLESYKNAQGISLYLNAGKPPFSDIRFRQAIFKAIDKQQMMDTIYGGQAWYFAGVRMPGEDYYLPQPEIKALYQQDLAGAKRLLTEAGVTAPLDFEIYVLGAGTTFKDAAELMQSDLTKIGVTTRIRISDANAAWTQAVFTDGAFDVGLGAATPVSANGDLFSIYHSSGNRNAGRVKDPAFDAQIEKQSVMVKDPEGRKKILQDIQRYLINNAQVLYLLGTMPPSLRWPYLKDYFFAQNMEETYPRLWLDK
jgi:peptide/nickel transport system substrate-binding protein